ALPFLWEPLDALPSAADARFEGGLRLHGYTLDVMGSTVNLRLFWQADGPLPADYALFVHVADPATDQPVAQFDGYPAVRTDEWTDGAKWVSQVEIALPDDLPPGEYAVNVGWAEHESGARLPAEGVAGGLVRLDTVAFSPPE